MGIHIGHVGQIIPLLLLFWHDLLTDKFHKWNMLSNCDDLMGNTGQSCEAHLHGPESPLMHLVQGKSSRGSSKNEATK